MIQIPMQKPIIPILLLAGTLFVVRDSALGFLNIQINENYIGLQPLTSLRGDVFMLLQDEFIGGVGAPFEINLELLTRDKRELSQIPQYVKSYGVKYVHSTNIRNVSSSDIQLYFKAENIFHLQEVFDIVPASGPVIHQTAVCEKKL